MRTFTLAAALFAGLAHSAKVTVGSQVSAKAEAEAEYYRRMVWRSHRISKIDAGESQWFTCTFRPASNDYNRVRGTIYGHQYAPADNDTSAANAVWALLRRMPLKDNTVTARLYKGSLMDECALP